MVYPSGTVLARLFCKMVIKRVSLLLYRLYAIACQLSPVERSSGVEHLETDTFKLHCLQTQTGSHERPLSNLSIGYSILGELWRVKMRYLSGLVCEFMHLLLILVTILEFQSVSVQNILQ